METPTPILANNTAASGPDCSGTLVGEGVNLRQNPTGCGLVGGVLLSGDPLLGTLASNGGTTQTRALGTGSPALSVGDGLTCATSPVNGIDQRGVARPQGPACDLGAYESGLTGNVGGKNLRITTGSINLAWDGGTVQTGYTLLRYNTSTTTADLIPVAGGAVSYSDGSVTNGVVYCYVLAATGPAGFLGLSDLLCGMAGAASGTVPPSGFTLALNQTSTATMTWSPPVGGADSYLLVRIPLDGSPIDNVSLGGGATSSAQAVVPAGMCFQLVAYRGADFGTSDVLCGVPGIATLTAVDSAFAALSGVPALRGNLGLNNTSGLDGEWASLASSDANPKIPGRTCAWPHGACRRAGGYALGICRCRWAHTTLGCDRPEGARRSVWARRCRHHEHRAGQRWAHCCQRHGRRAPGVVESG